MKFSRIIVLLAGLVFVGGLSLYLASLRPQSITVYEPSHAIGAYQRIKTTDFTKVKVLRDKHSANDITFDYLSKQLKKHGGFIYFDIAVAKGERVDSRHLRGNQLGTLSVVVAPDERVVAVSASLLGSVAGIVRPGDVVSVVGGDGAKLAEYAKVISVGVGAAAGDGVVTSAPSTSSSSKPSTSSTAASPSNGSLTLLLAVATDEAEALANSNQGVVLIYNPFCKTQPNGDIKAIDQSGASSACPQTAATKAATAKTSTATDSSSSSTSTTQDSGTTTTGGTSTTTGAG